MKKLAFFILLSFIFFSQPGYAGILDGLTIAPEVNTPQYKRGMYKHWIDADGDGLDTRQEVIAEEKLAGTLWVGSYTGKVTIIPNDLDVDHMVPLKEAHKSGGHSLIVHSLITLSLIPRLLSGSPGQWVRCFSSLKSFR